MTISRQPFPAQIMIAPKQMQNVDHCICLGTMITNDARCTCEIKYRTAMAKAAFNKKKTLFSSKLDLIRKKPVKCYIWSIALYCTATWTLQTVYQKYLKSFEMSCRRTEISCTDHVINEKVLQRVKEEMNILHTIKQREANWTDHNLLRNCLLNHIIEGKIEVMGTKSRRHKQLLDDRKAKIRYQKFIETVLDCIL
jgi:hypothetical protein